MAVIRAALVVVLALAALAATAAGASADACTPPVTNQVACENTKPGTDPDDWEINQAGDPSIQGFATSMSVNKGGTVSFKIKSSTPSYHIDILRLGYYGGLGARKVASNLTPTSTAAQPACKTDASTGLYDCGNWSVSRTWQVPSDAVSGVYIAHLVRNDNQGDSHIVFVVRDDASHSGIVYQTSDETWQAYNTYGGNSLYRCEDPNCPPGGPKAYKGAFKVSYNRPFNTEAESPQSALFHGAEYSMIRFLEANGYDVSYISGLDTERRGNLLTNHKLFMSSGHDEYWTGGQRTAVENARNAGVNLAFFSGNEVFWKTRWEPSGDGANTPDRTLVSYKDTHFDTRQDPVAWTGTWRDPRFTTDAEGIKPENALTGQSFVVNTGTSRITVPAAYGKLRMWRNTAAATLPAGGTLQLAPSTLGYEWDADPDNGFRPAGSIRLSSTTVSGVEVFTDYGSTTNPSGTATHNMTMYRAPSGARVFGAGTVQWAWGLDAANPAGNTVDKNMQQATVNLFADMGVQPSSLLSGLVPATQTTDTTGPTATITSPPSSVNDGTQVAISGTASDAGGQVAGIEVSTDGGSTWHPANGTTSWSYAWTAHGAPSTTIKVRASDDSGNIGSVVTSPAITVNCPCSLWGTSKTLSAAEADSGDTTSVEVGVKFRSDAYGTVSGVRFYKAATNTGTHVGSLWDANGNRLAQATFSNESASGWQTVTFDSPVPVQANTTYVASYHAPNGHYAATGDYFWRSPAPGPNGGATADSPPLHAVRNTATTGNGVYSYGAASTFPTNSFGAGNYWVDVLFNPTAAPGQVTGVTATAGGLTKANVSWTAPSSGGAPTSYEVTPYIGSTAQTTKTVSGSPLATNTTITGLTTGTTYTFRVRAVNPSGQGALSNPSNTVTPQTAVVPSVPTGVAAQAASTSAKVSWTAPESDGDSAITGYTITPYIGSSAQDTTAAGPSATSATVTGLTNGTAYTFKVTATNGVGNSPASAASNAVTPNSTIFDLATPATVDAGDTTGVEVGVKFKADYDGSITGVRFYKAAANIGTHVGTLWTAGGSRLGQATFSGETASGWQSVTFANPVAVTAGTTYVASYHAPSGHYSVSGGFANGVDNPPLHTIPNATSANGVYIYTSTPSTFPTATYNASNYWVDVTYAFPSPGTVTGVSATENGSTSARVSWTAPTSGGPVTSYKITPYIGSTAQTPKTVTGSPLPTQATVTGLTTGTAYTFRVQAVNANGAGPLSAASNSVTPTAAVAPSAPTGVTAEPATSSARVSWTAPTSDGDSPITGYTVTPYVGSTAQTPVGAGASATAATVTGLDNGTSYTFKVTATNAVGTSAASAASAAVTPQATIFEFGTPATADSGDTGAVEVGVKFQTDFAGAVSGIRFYKAAANTGTHVGSLWSATGTRLATATFTGETASGWQHMTFSSPVAVSPNTTYVASYSAPSGHYAVTGSGLSAAVDNPPLHTVANGISANGVFGYGPAGTFPTNSFGASNYWVDVLFAPAAAPGQVTGVTATAGQASATVSWTAPSTGGPVSSYEITPFIGSTAQTTTTVTGSPPATTKTITGLTAGTAYTFKVRAINPSGQGPLSAASNSVTPTGATAPGAPTAVTAQGDSLSAIVRWTAPADNGGSAITKYTVTPYAGATAQTPVDVDAPATQARITGLTNGTDYTFRVKAVSAAGSGADSSATSAVTPRPSIFELRTPATIDSTDTDAVVVGVKFKADSAGSITGIRFYKAANNTGTHVGGLWSSTGTLLREGTFSGESASGWQTLTFSTPVDITAGTTYVASYLAPNGHYSVTGSAFSSGPFDTPPLHALANADSPNGVYRYSTTHAFPSSSFQSANYWVDVLFAPGT
jgi:hypothetical protein